MNKLIVALTLGSIFLLSCVPQKYSQGKQIYETYCLNCHMADGAGMGKLYPNLSKSAYLKKNSSGPNLLEQLPCLIYSGSQSPILQTVAMPANPQIEPAAMTNLINYISNEWGDQQIITLAVVNKELAKCQK